MNSFIVLVTTIFAVLRVRGWRSQSFQALAHLWVGFMLGLSCVHMNTNTWYLAPVTLLSAVEALMFAIQRLSGWKQFFAIFATVNVLFLVLAWLLARLFYFVP